MLFFLALLHAGVVPAIVVFLIWSLPGAIGMYGLALGVQRVGQTLPSPVYALLSGLNSSTVGIIALAAVQLSEKAIKDKLTRILIIMGAAAGLCYNALWYFPLLMAIGGLTSVVWDGWLSRKVGKARAQLSRKRNVHESTISEAAVDDSIALEQSGEASSSQLSLHRRTRPSEIHTQRETSVDELPATTIDSFSGLRKEANYSVQIRVGLVLLVLFVGKYPK